MEVMKPDIQSDAEHLETVGYSIDFYLRQIQNEDTGRKSRLEYIRNLNILLGSGHYEIGLILDERDNLALAEIVGYPLQDLNLIGVDNTGPARRGDLVFENNYRRAFKLPVPFLPSNFDLSVIPASSNR